jgi:hypothetical protein
MKQAIKSIFHHLLGALVMALPILAILAAAYMENARLSGLI